MRMHIELEDDLVNRVDALAGVRGRTAFVRRAIEQAVHQADRSASLARAAGAISDGQHEWDADPARWVRQQRRDDASRGG